MENTAEGLQNRYIDFVLTHQKRPNSVRKFMQDLELNEKDFYDHFASFEALEASVWGNFVVKTLAKIQTESVYEQYSGREKLLAFYYTLLEILKENRSFVLFSFRPVQMVISQAAFLSDFETAFTEYANVLLAECLQNGEIADRMFLTDKYKKLIWGQTLFIVGFWAKDMSKNFEKTDAAIEKAVNLVFDTLSENIADRAFDFFKFLLSK